MKLFFSEATLGSVLCSRTVGRTVAQARRLLLGAGAERVVRQGRVLVSLIGTRLVRRRAAAELPGVAVVAAAAVAHGASHAGAKEKVILAVRRT